MFVPMCGASGKGHAVVLLHVAACNIDSDRSLNTGQMGTNRG